MFYDGLTILPEARLPEARREMPSPNMARAAAAAFMPAASSGRPSFTRSARRASSNDVNTVDDFGENKRANAWKEKNQLPI